MKALHPGRPVGEWWGLESGVKLWPSTGQTSPASLWGLKAGALHEKQEDTFYPQLEPWLWEALCFPIPFILGFLGLSTLLLVKFQAWGGDFKQHHQGATHPHTHTLDPFATQSGIVAKCGPEE